MTIPSKYKLYEASVMDAKADVKLMRRIYREMVGKSALAYREDFCGTFLHSVEWIKSSHETCAWAVDNSREPLLYGERVHYKDLDPHQKRRLHILRRDVLEGISRKVDLVTAMNFSYSLFKERAYLKRYFESVYRGLKRGGLFLLDVLGGTEIYEKSLERRRIKGEGMRSFDYFWEQKTFNPLTHESSFAIHFRLPGARRIRRNIFTYDWRLWSLPELKDLLTDVGFRSISIYWEGTTRKGAGNGIFSRKESVENSEVWIAYIAAQK